MERMTKRTVVGVANLNYPRNCYYEDGRKDQIAVSAYRQNVIEYLAAYEDTDLTPADINDLRNELCLKCGKYKDAHLGACDGCRWRKKEAGNEAD